MNEYFKALTKGSGRRRVAPLVLLLGLGSAFKLTFDAAPREQHVQLQLPEALRSQLGAVRLTYLEDNEAILGAEQRFTGTAPAVLTSAPELSPGEYQLDVELSGRDGSVTRSRHRLSVPNAGTVRIRVEQSP